MEIETKYSIGDTVWIKRFDFHTGIVSPEEKKINEIKICVKDRLPVVTYFLESSPDDRFSEKQLFSSKYECQCACAMDYKIHILLGFKRR